MEIKTFESNKGSNNLFEFWELAYRMVWIWTKHHGYLEYQIAIQINFM